MRGRAWGEGGMKGTEEEVPGVQHVHSLRGGQVGSAVDTDRWGEDKSVPCL